MWRDNESFERNGFRAVITQITRTANAIGLLKVPVEVGLYGTFVSPYPDSLLDIVEFLREMAEAYDVEGKNAEINVTYVDNPRSYLQLEFHVSGPAKLRGSEDERLCD